MPIPKLLLSVGLFAANMALTMTRKIEGPRLDDLKFTSGDYGAPLAMVWGKRRLQVPIFWAEDLREVKRRRKTKGGKFNEYTYFATWAVALAGHELGGITRVWFDTHLVFDLTGAGPVTPFDFGDGPNAGWQTWAQKADNAPGDGGEGTSYFAFYPGSETQEPDPRMQATVEAKHGEGSCPAYRGTAYTVFKDIPLEKLGNRIPQVSVEMVSLTEPTYPYEIKDGGGASFIAYAGFNRDYSLLYLIDGTGGGHFEIRDVASRSLVLAGTLPEPISNPERVTFDASGNFYAVSSDNERVLRFTPDLAAAQVLFTAGSGSEEQRAPVALIDGRGIAHWASAGYSFLESFVFDGALLDMEDLTGVDWRPTDFFEDMHGDIWAVGASESSSTTTAYFYRLVDTGARPGSPGFVTANGLDAMGSSLAEGVATHFTDGTNDHFVLKWGSGLDLYLIDSTTGAIAGSRASIYGRTSIYNRVPGAATIWEGEVEISLADLSTVRTIDDTDWVIGAGSEIFDPVCNATIGIPTDLALVYRYLDRVEGGGAPLGTIATDVADRCGVDSHSFAALDQVVPGWSATQGQGSNVLEPLFDAYDSDLRPHDFSMEGIKRAGISGGTMTTPWFVRKGDESRYKLTLRQASELPRAVTVSFADSAADQQPNNVRADRPLDATGARSEQSLDLTTLAIDADTARALTDRYMRRLWNGRKEVSLALTARELALEPGDCRALDLDGETDIYRLTRLTIAADDTLATEWTYDHPSLALVDGAAGAAFDGREPAVIAVPLISRGFVLDVPLLRDSDAAVSPGVYFAAAPYGEGTWPGATVYQAIDGEYSDEIGAVASGSQATWGFVAEALPWANPNLWDRGTEITVTLNVGSLTGATEAALNAQPTLNLAAIGAPGRWELVQFASATLIAENTYTLSGFKRGRRGSEGAGELHAANDVFLLLDTAAVAAMELSEVGTELSFKAVTSGRTAGGAFAVPLAPFTGASLKPYAPCHLSAEKDFGSGDWALSWVRRTRIGGAWTSGTAIPLAENSEEYEVEIMDGDTVVRTLAGLSSPAATYTAADQTTDFGAEVDPGDLAFRVYQISDAVDRGFPATATA